MPGNPNGRLQVVCGPMFAGKSEELLRRVRRAQLAGLAVEVVNHALDDRHAAGRVASHSGLSIASRSVLDVESLVELVGDRELDLLGIDEAQFFGPELVPAVSRLALSGMSVVVAGLCVTFDGRPFEPLPSLMALAEDVTKLTAVCAVCGAGRLVSSARPRRRSRGRTGRDRRARGRHRVVPGTLQAALQRRRSLRVIEDRDQLVAHGLLGEEEAILCWRVP
ncbi:thymidine kinase [Agromyces sp. GXQ0307]|uniref:thymidine kinase n=1 Tax=Agromyces sp. GXQ0307 TaxID=3377835 RepID=UPI003839FBB7